MASSSQLLLFLFVSFLLLCTAPLSLARGFSTAAAGASNFIASLSAIDANGKNYTKVCDPARFAADGLRMGEYRYCDAALPYVERVRDLVGRMTVNEKVANLGDFAPGAPRIGMPPYMWWSEGLHGVSNQGPGTHFDDPKKTPAGAGIFGATVFPNVINSGATFNETLWKTIGEAVSTEARAMYNEGYSGLTFWSPNINVVRDPRWGRTLETPGEDPYVVGRYAVNFVRGMQDVPGHETADDPNSRPLKVSTCCKHFAAYDLDNWTSYDRFHFDARVTERDMIETFVRPFEMCVREGDVSSVMCSYNRVNGVPACADPRLLKETIRDQWQLHGYIVSDCDSVRVMQKEAKWRGYTPEEASAAALKAGLDLDCGMSWLEEDGKPIHDYLSTYGMAAVTQGRIREPEINSALQNQYMTLMRLGFFDGTVPVLESLNRKDICTDEHKNLALDGARQSIVLLKNDGDLLPLDPKKLGSVSLQGPHVDAPNNIMLGDYTGPPCRYVTPRDAISKDVKLDDHATTVFYFAGLNLTIEREGIDRRDLLLPQHEINEINGIAATKGVNRIVLVVLSAGGVDVSFAQNNPKIGAIVWAGYPGEEGGTAIADVLFGRYNPGGRLPVTWYKNEYTNQIPMTSMALRPVPELGYPGRTYKFFNGSVVYPFGHGLSYTKFNFSYSGVSNGTSVTVPTTRKHCKDLSYTKGWKMLACPALNVDGHKCEETVQFKVTVANNGRRDGDHVVLVYTVPPPEVIDAPLKQLVAFRRVFVPALGTAEVPFTLNVCKAFGIVEKTAFTGVPAGINKVLVGNDESAVSFPVEIKIVL